MLSESSRIPRARYCHKQAQYSQRAIISNMSKTEKIWNHIRRLECGLNNVNYGDSQINLFCLTHSNISLTTVFSQRFFLTTSYNVFITMAFSQRLSYNVFLPTFLSHNVSLSQRLCHNVILTTISHNIPFLITSSYTCNLSTIFGRLNWNLEVAHL